MARVYIPSRDPEPVWPSVDKIADLFAALLIVIGGCWAVGWSTLV